MTWTTILADGRDRWKVTIMLERLDGPPVVVAPSLRILQEAVEFCHNLPPNSLKKGNRLDHGGLRFAAREEFIRKGLGYNYTLKQLATFLGMSRENAQYFKHRSHKCKKKHESP